MYVCQEKNVILESFSKIYSVTLLNAVIPLGITSCKYYSNGFDQLYTLNGILVLISLSNTLNSSAIWWIDVSKMFENINVTIVASDANFNITYQNKKCRELFRKANIVDCRWCNWQAGLHIWLRQPTNKCKSHRQSGKGKHCCFSNRRQNYNLEGDSAVSGYR